MDVLNYIIILPVIAGIFLFIFPERMKAIKASITLIITVVVLFFAYEFYLTEALTLKLSLKSFFAENSLLYQVSSDIEKYATFHLDSLSQLIVLFAAIFGFLISIYSVAYVKRQKQIYNYFPFFLITLGCSIGAILSDNLILFLFFWGILGFTLYKLIKGHDEESSAAAKKTLIMIGASDGIMIIGIAIIWHITGTLNMSELNISTNSSLAIWAFITLLVGSFTKAGAFPFHTWIPDFAKKAPASSTAYLPASLDKLLGIYFLVRICVDIFTLNQWLTLVLMIIGVFTIIFAVMMALIQHNYKRLLGFHAVSQVGYMVVGIAIATPLGIAAGLFHMINHALYKSGLFLSAGSIHHRTGKNDLGEISGLSSKMPVTFISALIFALAISGIPPLNGFASKWMIYQGLIDFGNTGAGIASQLWIVWLALAVLGSALTLASFIKFISGIFLGRRSEAFDNIKEVNFLMWFPKIILALICLGFGIFATSWVVPKLFYSYTGAFDFVGAWPSNTVSLLILFSIILGFIIYLIGNIKNMRTADSFIGGESFRDSTEYNVTEFYNTIREFKFLKSIYSKAEKRWFDIYTLLKQFFYGMNFIFSKMHTGVLTTYAIWFFAGFIIIILCLI